MLTKKNRKQKKNCHEKKNKILIVEDELIIAVGIKRSLQNMEYEITELVTSGEGALESCNKNRPDLVLMDIRLEGELDGIGAADIIFTDYNIPVIFLTSYGDQQTISEAVKSQPFGYILKPFEDKELHAAIEMALYKFKMENKLRNSQKFLKQIIDTSPNLIYVYDKSSKYLVVNRALGKFLQVEHDTMIGKELKQILKEELPLKEYTRVLHDNLNGSNEYEITTRTGTKKSYKMNKIDIVSPDNIPCSLAVGVDITKLKNAEMELKKSYRKLENTFRDTVKVLASASEIRDPYTAGHQRRVADLSVKIAQELKLEDNIVDGIFMTALIHDIGKILIPVEILNKPGILSDVEMEYIKQHSQEGYNILKNIEFPWPVADIVLQHHEKIDGSSYPNGLTGDEILLEARIICVADVIEAMSSHRPYRPSQGIEVALEEIEKNKGILYDKQVADVCLYIFRKLNYQFPKAEI